MRYVRVDDVLDPRPYLDALPGLHDSLPPGAYRFASDPTHYDFASSRCVHDLELGSVTFLDEPGGAVEVWLVGQRTHDADLTLRYWGLRSWSTTVDGPVLGHRALGDLMLDELLPEVGGVRHELAFEGGRVEIVAEDVSYVWIERPADREVFVFIPDDARSPAGVWSSASEAESWIAAHDARGALCKYELGSSAYDAAVARGLFKPKHPDQRTPGFAARFTSSIDHWHYGHVAPP